MAMVVYAIQHTLSFLKALLCLSPAATGLQLKLDGQDRPFVSFTYALSPLTDKLAPVDWKLLVTTEDTESQHIRCHELQTGDNLPELVASFQNLYAVAVVLINTSDDFTLDSTFLAGTQEGSFPVLLLTKTDGMALLNKVEQFEENVFARISVESFVDLPTQQTTPQKTGKGHAHTSSEQTKEPGQYVPQVSVRSWTVATQTLTICVDIIPLNNNAYNLVRLSMQSLCSTFHVISRVYPATEAVFHG